jgi:hypothetical protein
MKPQPRQQSDILAAARAEEAAPVELEPCLSAEQIADCWGKSKDTVRRIFAEEEGVLWFGHQTLPKGRSYKRRYYSMRVPMSVFLRVQDRLRSR